MSARPRPVTATVTKPEWMKAEYAYRPYRHSLDSTGSTDSLISCLDHDSYESSADDEQDAPAKIVPPPQDINASCVSEYSDRPTQDGDSCKKKVTRKIAFCDVENESMLSPWEKWLVQKAQEDRFRKQELLLRKKEQQLKKQLKEQEKQLTLQKAEIKREEWLKKKDYEERLRAKLQQQRLSAEKEIKETEKKQVQEKSDLKYKEWMQMKKEQQKRQKKMEKAKMEEEERKRLERKEMAEKKYEEWLKQAEHRPKSAPLPKDSKGENVQVYPAPTFCNPIPWQPIHIPRYKEDQKKRKPKKKKYIWNPNKYF